MKDLCNKHHARLLILLEPMSDVALIASIRLLLSLTMLKPFWREKFRFFCYNDVSISFMEYAEQLVHMVVNFFAGYSICLFSVYAKCTRVARHSL